MSARTGAIRPVPAGSSGTQKVRCIYILHNFAQSDENSPNAAAALSKERRSVCVLRAVRACCAVGTEATVG